MSTKHSIKIFLVDDDPMFLAMLEDSLKEAYHYEIKTFGTGELCIKELTQDKPDMILLDYQLNSSVPDAMDGLECLNRLKVINQDIPVVLVSGSDDENVERLSKEYGTYAFIHKDAENLANIHTIIKEVIDQTSANPSSGQHGLF